MGLSLRQLAQRDANLIMKFAESENLTKADGAIFRGKIAETAVEFVGDETATALSEIHLYTDTDLVLGSFITDGDGIRWEIVSRIQSSGVREYKIVKPAAV